MMINLDMNENRCIDPISLQYEDMDYCGYPRGLSSKLIKKISNKYGINEETIILTNGIDEGIHLFCSYIKNNGWTLLVDTPNYVGVLDAIDVIGVNVVFNKQTEKYDCQKTIACIESHDEIRAVYIANPRNPVGDYIEDVELIISYCADKEILVFLDEAYIEFCEGHVDVSIGFLSYNNLVIARTFSKAYGLASIRCGYVMVSDKKILREFKNIWSIQPYHMSQHSLMCALLALDDDHRLFQSLERIQCQKEKLYRLLENTNVPYIRTQTNFVCFKNEDSLFESLMHAGIRVMPAEPFGFDGYFRITIAGEHEMQRLFEVITDFFGGKNEAI